MPPRDITNRPPTLQSTDVIECQQPIQIMCTVTVIQRPTRLLRNSNTQPAISNPNDSIPKYLAIHLQKMQPTITLPSAIQPTNVSVAYRTDNSNRNLPTSSYISSNLSFHHPIHQVIHQFTNQPNHYPTKPPPRHLNLSAHQPTINTATKYTKENKRKK